MSKADEPAFAHVILKEGIQYVARGLTKREYFAAMAMMGRLARHLQEPAYSDSVADWAVGDADALIAALERKPE